VATIKKDLQKGTIWYIFKDTIQYVVSNVGTIPIHVIGADKFIEVVHDFVAVPVPDLGAVPGEVEHQEVARFGSTHQPFQPVNYVIFGGTAVCKNTDIPGLEIKQAS